MCGKVKPHNHAQWLRVEFVKVMVCGMGIGERSCVHPVLIMGRESLKEGVTTPSF